MKASSTNDEKQPDYEEFDKEALLSVEQLFGKQIIHANQIDTDVITKMEFGGERGLDGWQADEHQLPTQ